ncbi:CPBP family intramembrane glutamic endopeptidase [Arenimonas composti]|uniref:CPBP family intramembrane glutamic endopeptidase n=1 Tax=Arenimonas composti TaxID=370776 RepID=UPI00041BCEA6|nr:type II CAAX endopeptidase family protein [Arenimonas composti]
MPRSPVWVLVAVGLWVAAAVAFVLSPWFPQAKLGGVAEASGGWLSATVLAALATAVVAYALVFGPGRQRPGDVGWRGGALVPALAVTLGLWLAMQFALWITAETGASAALHPAWAAGAAAALAPLLAQVVATALFEETVFRGWLWPQLALRLRAWLSPWLAAGLAMVLSQAVFALLHLPGLLQAGLDGQALDVALLMLFLSGLVLALVYAATGNLFIAVGAHALGNAPTPLLAGGEPGIANNVLLLGLVGVMLLGGLLRWRQRRRG